MADPGEKKSCGWMPIDTTVQSANILFSQTKDAEALKVMGRYDESDAKRLGVVSWRRMLRMYGQIYAALHQEEECMAKFHAALALKKD